MIRLVVAKIGNEYLRLVEDGFELCSLAKASVFPENQVEELRLRLEALGERTSAVRLMLLTISEQPFGG